MTQLSVELIQNGKLKIEFPLGNLSVLEDGQTHRAGQHLMRIINQKDGDKRIVWDSMNFDEVHDAKAMFDKLVLEGMVPYAVDEKGRKTPHVISEFDPCVEEIIFAPIALLRGG